MENSIKKFNLFLWTTNLEYVFTYNVRAYSEAFSSDLKKKLIKDTWT